MQRFVAVVIHLKRVGENKMLKGKVAVITGANRGIGKALVEKFAQNHCDIYACSREKSYDVTENYAYLMKEYGVNISPIYFDLNDEKQIVDGMKEILKSKEKIDVLVNNAGMIPKASLFQMTSIEDMKHTFDINYFSQLLITQYISRNMIKHKGGSIINIASVSAIDGEPGEIDYISSKAAMIGTTKKLSIELGAYGIRVNAIAPGMIKTQMGEALDEKQLDVLMTRTTMKRMGEAQEVANSVMFFASDLSTYITGQVLRVDGGMK